MYAYMQSIVFAITYHPSYRKCREGKTFPMEKPSARGLKMLFNFFQHALVARNTTLAWLLFKARRSKRREKMCESMITRGIMRVGVWKVSKCISAESNGASIFRNVHVRWGSTNATQRMYIHTRTFGIRVVLRFSNGMPFVLFWYPLWIFFFCLGKQEFMVLTMRRVARHDCVFTCIYIYIYMRWLKSGAFARRWNHYSLKRVAQIFVSSMSLLWKAHNHYQYYMRSARTLYIYMCVCRYICVCETLHQYRFYLKVIKDQSFVQAFTTLSIKFVSDNVFTDFSYISSNWYEW